MIWFHEAFPAREVNLKGSSRFQGNALKNPIFFDKNNAWLETYFWPLERLSNKTFNFSFFRDVVSYPYSLRIYKLGGKLVYHQRVSIKMCERLVCSDKFPTQINKIRNDSGYESVPWMLKPMRMLHLQLMQFLDADSAKFGKSFYAYTQLTVHILWFP